MTRLVGVASRRGQRLDRDEVSSAAPSRLAVGERSAVASVTQLAVLPIALVVVVKSALNLAVAARYGWHRDELYYAVAGTHLQGGYVEFPPATALLAALAHAVFGWSLVGFRAFAVAAGAGSIVVGALVARELGGGRRAQLLAAAAIAFSPALLAANGLYQPVSLDQLSTLTVLWLALRALQGRGSWLAAGVAAGIGLETKYTLAVPLVLLVLGVALWRRDALDRRLLAAAGAAAAILIPNVLWQAHHDWASVRWFAAPPASASDETRVEYALNLLLLVNLVALPVAVLGVRALWCRSLRPLALAVAGSVVFYFAAGGKSYYAMPAVLFAVAAGAPLLERRASRRLLVAASAGFAAITFALVPIALPLLPVAVANRLGILDLRSDFRDELGWPSLAQRVGRLSQDADVIVTRNYGEAGALALFGRGLPPIASGEVTFRFWQPRVSGREAVLVGLSLREATFCAGYRVVASISMPVANEEAGRPIARCRLRGSLRSVWPEIVALHR